MGGSDTLKDFEIDEKLQLRRLLVWEFGSWCCNIYSGPHVFLVSRSTQPVSIL